MGGLALAVVAATDVQSQIGERGEQEGKGG